MSKSKIEWTSHTWNPTVGCSKVSAGCDRCYAIMQAARLQGMGKPGYAGVVTTPADTAKGKRLNWTGKVNLVESALEIPLKIKKPTMFFVDSMSDLFHENVPFDFNRRFMGIVKQCPQHIFQVLTKRPERMLEFFMWIISRGQYPMAFPNLWLGVSVEEEIHLDRIDTLRKIPAAIRMLSIEPLLEDLGEINLEEIHWVIVGGESGPKARPMRIEWAEAVMEQCKQAGVAFYMKQIIKNRKKIKFEDFPENLKVREYPK